jgi:acetyltransferase-like isoleucine patch superfamily enzyme
MPPPPPPPHILNGDFLSLENRRRVSVIQKLKHCLLCIKYRKKLRTKGYVRILGPLPLFKLPRNGKIILGNKVVLNSDFYNTNTALSFRCKLNCGIEGLIEIGDNTMLNGVSITAYKKVFIGENCQIASNTFISDTDFHPINSEMRRREVLGYKIDYSNVNKEEIVIGNNVWIGWGCIILKGVTIGDNAIIAAGSVVIKNVPPNSLAAGNPATIKKQYL